MKSVLLPVVVLLALLTPLAAFAQDPTAPTVVIQSATMRPGTTLMDVVYRVNDTNDATVKTRALAFVDGVRSFANVIRPVTFVEGTGANLGDSVAANVDHTLTWDVATDWDIDLGQVKFEVLAMDGRGLLPFEWITIPAVGEEPELTISKSAPGDQEVLDAFFWQFASADPGLGLVDGVLNGSAGSGLLAGIPLVEEVMPTNYGILYILRAMNLAAGDQGARDYALDARASISEPTVWHALSQEWENIALPIGWGFNQYGQATPPEIPDDFTAIAAGAVHSLALLSNGTVVGWGRDDSGQATPPEGLADVTAIAAGNVHSLALLGNGTVIGWGSNSYGQATPPAGLADVKSIAACLHHSLALLGNGTVVGWGDNGSGQATPPEGLADVIAIAAGYGHSLALLENGTVVGWGSDGDGQATPPEGLADVIAIAAGSAHSLALLSNGTVVGWGSNTNGQATPPEGLADVTAITTYSGHSLALLGNGTVVGWGADTWGQATPPEGLSDVTAIAAGAIHSLVLREITR